MTKRNATMRDVATRAGVSPATVSYVLNNRNRVGAAVRQRVLDAMTDLSYYPSAAARSLVRQRTNLIAFLIPHRPDSVFLDPYFAELMRGVAIMADAHEYNPVVVTVEGHDHARAVSARLVRNNQVDGIIISYLSDDDAYLLMEMEKATIPFVIIGSAKERTDAVVDIDNCGGAEQAITHLLGLGHRAIGFINGPGDAPHAKQRLLGVRGALLAHDQPLSCCTVVNGGFSREGAYAAMQQLLTGNSPPTAVFAASDQMAVGALHYLHERGVRVPGDVSLVGFDDNVLATATYPALTTVRQPIRQLGEMAADLLFKKIRSLPLPPSIILSTELIVRDSTGAPPVDIVVGAAPHAGPVIPALAVEGG